MGILFWSEVCSSALEFSRVSLDQQSISFCFVESLVLDLFQIVWLSCLGFHFDESLILDLFGSLVLLFVWFSCFDWRLVRAYLFGSMCSKHSFGL